MQDLPGFPDEKGEIWRKGNENHPPRGEVLCSLFEFGTGLAMANVIFLGLMMPWFVIDAKEWAIVEAALLFGFFGVLVVGHKMSELEDNARVIWPFGFAIGFALAGVLACGLGIGFVLWFFAQLESLVGPLKSPLDHLIASALFGALAGLVAAGGLALVGGTPDRVTGWVFNALGKIIPKYLRKCLFRKQRHDIQLAGKPWLEGAVWAGMVGGPIIWFLC